MVARNTAVARQSLVHLYDDGPGGRGATEAKERAFRESFLAEVRRVVRLWAHPPEEPQPRGQLKVVQLSETLKKGRFNASAEISAARNLRQQVREHHTVYRQGSSGPKTYHLGYRLGHEVPAARARGSHQALEYVTEPWRNAATFGVDVLDSKLLRPWLAAVERWAESPIRPEAPTSPPKLLEVGAATAFQRQESQLIPVSTVFTEPALICPVCEFEYVHLVAVEACSSGQADGQLRIDAKGLHLAAALSPDGRDMATTLSFRCENGHIFTYGLRFHKGLTFLDRTMANAPPDTDQGPKTICSTD